MFKSIKRSSSNNGGSSSSSISISRWTGNVKITGIIFVIIIQSFVVNLYLHDIHYHEQHQRQHVLQQRRQIEEVVIMPTTTTKASNTNNNNNTNTNDSRNNIELRSWWRGQFDTSNLTHPFLGAYYHNPDNNHNRSNHNNNNNNSSSSSVSVEAGWIVNPSIDRLRKVQFEDKYILTTQQDYVCNGTLIQSSSSSSSQQKDDTGSGIEGDGGHKVLMKVQRGLDKARKQLRESKTMTTTTTSISKGSRSSSNSTNSNNSNSSKILCMIYTYHSNNDGHKNLESIADTWGRRCDGFIGFSNFTDHSVGAINIAHAGPESLYNMWQKVRSIWTYVYQHYINEYDYFFISGDDVYMAVENLRIYLDGPDVQRYYDNGGSYLDRISSHPKHIRKARKVAAATAQHNTRYGRPLLFGAPMVSKHIPVIAGGPGYILNAAALDIFGTKGGTNMYETDTYDSKEDWLIGQYFVNHGIYISDTRDNSRNGEDSARFGPGGQFTYQFNGVKSPTRPKRLHSLYGLGIKSQLDSISEQQISFHLKDDYPYLNSLNSNNYTISQLMIRYHAILYHWCE